MCVMTISGESMNARVLTRWLDGIRQRSGTLFARSRVHGASSLPASVPSSDRREGSPESRFLAGLATYHSRPERLPAYVSENRTEWPRRADNCYSFLFHVAIVAGLMAPDRARELQRRIRPGEPGSFRAVMFPGATRRLPVQLSGEVARLPRDPIPSGWVVSLDGGAHVMVSTGRLTPEGRHEVYSFKGGDAGTPVWGDSMPEDPHPRLHRLTIEDELENLLRDDQDLSTLDLRVGPSILTAPGGL